MQQLPEQGELTVLLVVHRLYLYSIIYSFKFIIITIISLHVANTLQESSRFSPLLAAHDPNLSVRPKYDQLIELLDTLVNWQKFGTFLPGIKSEHIQVIERDFRGTDLQKAALFSKWLSVHPEASWKDVLFALEKSQEYSLASRVYQKLNTTLSTASTISQGMLL